MCLTSPDRSLHQSPEPSAEPPEHGAGELRELRGRRSPVESDERRFEVLLAADRHATVVDHQRRLPALVADALDAEPSAAAVPLRDRLDDERRQTRAVHRLGLPASPAEYRSSPF